MEVILITLLQYIRENDEDATNVQIAVALIKHLMHLKEPTLNELAECCHCSPSTFSRFLKTVGLKNYRRLMLLLSQPQLVYHNEGFDARTYQSLCIENISHVDDDDKTIRQLALSIFQAERVVFVTFPTHYALTLDFQCKMLLEDKYIEILSLNNGMRILDSLTPRDLILYLTFSGKEHSFFHLNHNVPSILITQNAEAGSPAKRIICGTSNQYGEGKYALLYFLDCLYQSYHNLKDVGF